MRMEYIPTQWKKAQVIMLLKPGKPSKNVTLYRPISFLLNLSTFLEKLLLKRILPIIEEKYIILEQQFGFCNKNSTIDQIRRITNMISKAFEEKKYCCRVFFHVAQAFDEVWQKVLLIKLCKHLPYI